MYLGIVEGMFSRRNLILRILVLVVVYITRIAWDEATVLVPVRVCQIVTEKTVQEGARCQEIHSKLLVV